MTSFKTTDPSPHPNYLPLLKIPNLKIDLFILTLSSLTKRPVLPGKKFREKNKHLKKGEKIPGCDE